MLNTLKTNLSELLHLSKDALHVHLGLGLFLLAIVVLRRSPASLVPLFCVLGLELVNELVDALHWHGGVFDFNWLGGLKDIANTMLWPFVLFALARFTKWRGPVSTPTVPPPQQ